MRRGGPALSAPRPADIVRRVEEVTADRPPLLILEPLLAYLDEQGVGSGELTIAALGDGRSNVTYAVTRGDARFILRRPPRPPYPKSAHDVIREGRIVQALAGTGARVPRVLAICADDGVIGAPFYLAELVEGEVFTEATPDELATPRERDRVADELVSALLEIHRTDWHAAGLASFGRPSGYLERQVRRFAGLLDEYRTRPIPALDAVTEWLGANIPRSAEATIVHGDYRLGNVMFARSAPARLVAVLDWELATIGDPLADVGYMCAMWAEPGDPEGLQKLSRATIESGYPGRRALARRYAIGSGRSLEEITWYMTLALWKFCVIMEGNYRRALSGMSDDDFARRFGDEIPLIAAQAERLAANGA
jgi:aminoglycoside phosphotransferase (APT) family kinase protein